MTDEILRVEGLTHRYGGRMALGGVSLSVRRGEIFGLLGPNGSGKTTLFRILSTLIPPAGDGRVVYRLGGTAGLELPQGRDEVRRHIGVVFQSPSLDKQLTGEENLRHHGHLYGLRGAALRARVDEMLAAFGVADRAKELVGTLSGGLRVELAKGLLNRPGLLILDEPSTGLDPSARIELWQQLQRIRQDGVTVLLTTHLMDEADRCDRLAILHAGRLMACDSPDALKRQVGGDVITLVPEMGQPLERVLAEKLSISGQMIDGALRLELENGHTWVPRIVEAAPGMIRSISVGRPTLEDVFVRITGHAFRGIAAA